MCNDSKGSKTVIHHHIKFAMVVEFLMVITTGSAENVLDHWKS